MKYESLFKNSKIFVDSYNKHLSEKSLPGDGNSYVSIGLTHMSLEYHESIIILMGHGAYRASGALIRPQYEALVRGMYFYHCASPEKADDFSKGVEPPKIFEMITQIEKIPRFEGGHLSRFHSRNAKTMHDLTHGGVLQFERSFTGNELSPNFTDQDKYDLLKSSCLLAATAASHIAVVSGDENLGWMLQDEFHKLCLGGP